MTPRSGSGRSTRSGARILVVEDEPAVAMGIQHILRVYGYEVLEPTVSGDDAIRRAAADTPDLVLMDIRLKGIVDGIDAAKEIQRRFDIPVVFLTAHTDRATVGRATQAHPYGYVRKPFEGSELWAAIEVAIHRHQAEVERHLAEAERLRSVEQALELERLHEVSRSKNEFLNMAAHELRTPLTPIQYELEILIRSLSDVPGRTAQSLKTLSGSFARLSHIVGEILDAARLHTTPFGIACQPFDLSPVIGEAIDAVRSHAAAKNIALHAPMTGHLRVVGDVTRTRQVLANLLSNAMKYTPDDGGVSVTVRDVGDMVEVRVEDTGIGFNPADADTLFQPFARLPHADVGPLPGAGLGLYISKGLVEQMGGRIGCEGKGPGRGAVFFFSLPTAAAGPS